MGFQNLIKAMFMIGPTERFERDDIKKIQKGP